MTVNIGYACLTLGVPNTQLKGCLLKNADKGKLAELITHNLGSLENIIDYNIKTNINLFRISSNLIPFGSSQASNLIWWDMFSAQLLKVGEKIINSGMRVSMHPGQYTVLNSPNIEVVKKAIEDLNYHAQIMDSLNVSVQHKIVLHIGGVYNDKKQAGKRFIANYLLLNEAIKQRIVLENDDKSYNINDVLEIGIKLNIPVVFDNLHNKVNPSDPDKSDYYWINECNKTWREKDGCQKIHYSQQNPLKKPGSHSTTIAINEFLDFYQKLESKDLDIMLEVKDKNLSAIKCIDCTLPEINSSLLELQWAKYKYKILEKSPSDYRDIEKKLSTKRDYPAIAFYKSLEDALKQESQPDNLLNAAIYIWGLFDDIATAKEKVLFYKTIDSYKHGRTSLVSVKNYLWRIAEKYQRNDIRDSYYFII